VVTELNISSNNLGIVGGGKPDMSGVIALANVIPDMGAISTVIMYKFPLPIQDIKTKVELDFSTKELNYLDAIVLAALLPLNVNVS
jgi:hypothetical protein